MDSQKTIYSDMPQQLSEAEKRENNSGMIIYVIACVAHLVFCACMVLSMFGMYEINLLRMLNQSSVILFLGLFSSLMIFIGLYHYCKSRTIKAPNSLLIGAQVVFLIIQIAVLFRDPFVLCSTIFALVPVYFMMLLGRFLVGIQFIRNHRVGLGLLMICVAISIILFSLIYLESSADRLELRIVEWCYIVMTTLESIVFLLMFAGKIR